MKIFVVTTLVAVIYFSACNSQQRTTTRPTTTTRPATTARPTTATRQPSEPVTTQKGSTQPSRPSAVGMSAGRTPAPGANTGSIFGDLECGVTTASAIGGEDALKRQYPWITTISSEYGNCGGTLLSREWVLTAAQCIFYEGDTAADVDIEFGDIFESEYRIRDPNDQLVKRKAALVVKHPDFDNSWSNNRGANYSYDFALLKLDRPINFTDFIKPICLPDSSRCSFVENAATVDGCSKVTIAKWSTFFTDQGLKNKTLTVFSPSECRQQWGAGDTNICAGLGTEQTSTCTGDSGSAAFCALNGRQTAVGIASFGTPECGVITDNNPDGYPTGLARVCKVLPWIQATVQNYAGDAVANQSPTTRRTTTRRSETGPRG